MMGKANNYGYFGVWEDWRIILHWSYGGETRRKYVEYHGREQLPSQTYRDAFQYRMKNDSKAPRVVLID